MPPRKQRSWDQQPELRPVDQQSEQSAGEQRPSLEQAQAATEQRRRPGAVLSADRVDENRQRESSAPWPGIARRSVR